MPSTHIVVDLGFGDAGKGTMVDAIARRCSSPPLVVRHNGGAQAGHNVHLVDGRHHTFSQFGSAMFVPGSRTLLSKHFVLHPLGLAAERDALVSIGVDVPWMRLLVDERALVITPYQQAVNRLRELARGERCHGTCGLGVGETVGDDIAQQVESIYAGDLSDHPTLLRKLEAIRVHKLTTNSALVGLIENDDAAVLKDAASVVRTAARFVEIGRRLKIVNAERVDHELRETADVIFEGAQGVLLDEWHGFHPHTTWSTTTSANANAMIAQSGRGGPVQRLGVLRAYATRHGQGPFPTYSARLTEKLREVTNTDDGPQGRFRCGWFDAPLTRYALAACPGIDSLAVTCLDRLETVPRNERFICVGYEYSSYGSPQQFVSKPGDLAHQERLTVMLDEVTPTLEPAEPDVQSYVQEIANQLDRPVVVTSFGPTAKDKVWP